MYSVLLIISVLVEINKELFRLAGVLEFINQSILKEMDEWTDRRIMHVLRNCVRNTTVNNYNIF